MYERPSTKRMNPIAQKIIKSVEQHVSGKRDVIELAVIALFASGHLLIEDRPGVGKTLLARSLAACLDLPFQRIQCTSDLLPSDLIGAQIYHPRTGQLTFRPGPVFTSVLLADELNRTPPRTQSALLECMAEGNATVAGDCHPLPDSFFVIATQNPTTSAGTYQLPDNQLDRFLLKVEMGYLDPRNEIDVVANENGYEQLESAEPTSSVEELNGGRRGVRDVRCDEELVTLMVNLANRTRNSSHIARGVSTRGVQALHRSCRARAFIHGRNFVVPDDIRTLLTPAWSHRVQSKTGATAESLLHEILAEATLPE